MFENIKKIKIKGRCFENETELELFKKDAMTIIYGRNGSGKTTIASSIKTYVSGIIGVEGEDTTNDLDVILDSEIPIEYCKGVYVFDEDFVTNQVRVSGDGINTIVMLGEQVELDEQIAKEKENYLKIEKKLNDLKELQNRYDDAETTFSPMYYYNKIRDGLREDGGWADIDRDVKGNTLKSRVTIDVVNNLLTLEEPKVTYEKLREQLMKNVKLYLESENAEIMTWKADVEDKPENLYVLNNMLKRPLDSPQLTERESRLMNMVAMSSHYSWHFSQQNTRQLIDDGWTFCPLCLREIKEQDKYDIVETMAHILNREAEEYAEKLTKQLEGFAEVKNEIPVFPGGLNEKEVNAAKVAQGNFNSVLAAVRSRIEQRKRNIYKRMAIPFTEEELKAYEIALSNWKNSLNRVAKCVDTFNSSVNKRRELYDKIIIDNNLLARKLLATLLQGYRQAEANSKSNKEYIVKKNDERHNLEMKIKQLIQRKERTDIALDYINKELQYVFFSNKKVRLESGEGCYKLKVNGRSVKPSKISVGERNVLGLCYFFAKLYNNKSESTKYSSEYFIVIDDPVSSFDYGNRVGVMSLLRYQFNNILKGNANSRILVLSHDLHSVFDLVKIRNEVVKDMGSDKSFMELLNNKLDVKFLQNEYQKLLNQIYEYAVYNGDSDPDETWDMSIGNIMRRMLEAFSSFNYNENFEKMMRKADLLAMIPEEKRVYYENFMSRLTLNSESHSAENIYSLNTITPYFTREEKVQTAKSLLLFLLYINRTHMEAYFVEKGDRTKINTIESWMAEEALWIVDDKGKTNS